jgi:hypothetical protein
MNRHQLFFVFVVLGTIIVLATLAYIAVPVMMR